MIQKNKVIAIIILSILVLASYLIKNESTKSNTSINDKSKSVSVMKKKEDLIIKPVKRFIYNETFSIKEWKAYGFTSGTSRNWKNIDLERRMSNYYKLGLHSPLINVPPSYAYEFEKANIDNYWGAIWYATGHHWKDAIRLRKNWLSQCGQGVKENIMIFREKGGLDGDCYWIRSNVLQWISPSENMISDSGKVYYVEYPDNDAPENGIYGIAKRSGSVTYRNTLGKTVTTPKFTVVALIYGS